MVIDYAISWSSLARGFSSFSVNFLHLLKVIFCVIKLKRLFRRFSFWFWGIIRPRSVKPTNCSLVHHYFSWHMYFSLWRTKIYRWEICLAFNFLLLLEFFENIIFSSFSFHTLKNQIVCWGYLIVLIVFNKCYSLWHLIIWKLLF